MSKYLFQLIKKLSPNEKGYLKKVSKAHTSSGSTVYIRLFDILDRQSHYNKVEVNAYFDKKVITQLPVISNYLFYLILDTLEEFHSGKTMESRLKKLIANAEHLYSKGLYEQARLLIDKVKVKAEKGENFLLILQIYAFEGRLSLLEENIENMKKYADTVNIAQKLVVEKFVNYTEYRQFVSRLFYLSKSSGRHLKSEKDQKELIEIMKHPLLSDRKFALSVSALNSFLLIHSYYNDIKKERDISKSFQFNMERLNLLEVNIDYTSQSPSHYLSALNNLLLNAGELFDINLFTILLEKVKNANKILKIKPIGDVENFRNFIYLKYSIFQSFISGDFQAGINIIKGKETVYYNLHAEKSEEELLVFCHNTSTLFFGVGDYKQALYWINKLLQSGLEMLRMDIRMNANWMNVFIQIELENYEYASSLIRSFIRFIDKHRGEFIFEKEFAKTLRSYIDSALNHKTTEQSKNLQQLVTILHSRKKSGLVNDTDFVFLLPWVKSKIEKCSFLEMYKKCLPEFKAG